MATYSWFQRVKGKFYVVNASSKNLKGKFTVQPYCDLKGKFIVRHTTAAALKGVVALRRTATSNLQCAFNVNHQLNVKGAVFLSHRAWLNQGLTDLALIDAGVLT